MRPEEEQRGYPWGRSWGEGRSTGETLSNGRTPRGLKRLSSVIIEGTNAGAHRRACLLREAKPLSDRVEKDLPGITLNLAVSFSGTGHCEQTPPNTTQNKNHPISSIRAKGVGKRVLEKERSRSTGARNSLNDLRRRCAAYELWVKQGALRSLDKETTSY